MLRNKGWIVDIYFGCPILTLHLCFLCLELNSSQQKELQKANMIKRLSISSVSARRAAIIAGQTLKILH